jgi:hypothetical protein
MRRFLLSVALALILAVQAAATDIVYFSSPYCGPCQEMKPVIAELEQSGYDVQRVDVSKWSGLWG